MESPAIDRGKAYKGPRGASNAHIPVSQEDYESRHRRVSLILWGQQPEEITPLIPTMGEDPMPGAARTLFRECARAGRRFDSWRHTVRPVTARSRRAARAQDVVYVRVWVHTRDVCSVCVLRAWRRPEGTDKWITMGSNVYRPWRKNAVGTPISAKQATEIIKTGVWVWRSG